MRVPKIFRKGVLFRATKSGPRIVKKGGVFDFSPGDFFKKGVFFFLSLSLWTPEKCKKGCSDLNFTKVTDVYQHCIYLTFQAFLSLALSVQPASITITFYSCTF